MAKNKHHALASSPQPPAGPTQQDWDKLVRRETYVTTEEAELQAKITVIRRLIFAIPRPIRKTFYDVFRLLQRELGIPEALYVDPEANTRGKSNGFVVTWRTSGRVETVASLVEVSALIDQRYSSNNISVRLSKGKGKFSFTSIDGESITIQRRTLDLTKL